MRIGVSKFWRTVYVLGIVFLLIILAFFQVQHQSQSRFLDTIYVWDNDLTLALSRGDKNFVEMIGKTALRDAVSYVEFRIGNSVFVSMPTLASPETCHFATVQSLQRYGQQVGEVKACFDSSTLLGHLYTSPIAFFIAFLLPIIFGFAPILTLVGYRKELFHLLRGLENWNLSERRGNLEDALRTENVPKDAVSKQIIELFEKGVRERVAMSKQAERSMAIAQMVQMLAHDVRKPFISVSAALATMEKAKTPSEVQRIVAVSLPDIQKSLATVNGLIQDVMEIDSSAVLAVERVAVTDLLLTALSDVFRFHGETNIALEYDLQHTLDLEIARGKVLRVFSNILTNGVQAMEMNGRISILSKDVSISFVEFTLKNDGPSIPQEHLPRLFDAFFTSGKKSGTGLGLAIAHKVVAAHGGAIRCESGESRGVSFVFTLPGLPKTNAQEAPRYPSCSKDFSVFSHPLFVNNAITPLATESPSTAPATAARIAVVDDDAVILMAWELMGSNIICDTFQSPEAFFERLQADATYIASLTAVVTDFHFDNSKQSGIDFAEKLKDAHPSANIFLSTNATMGANDIGPSIVAAVPKNPDEALAAIFKMAGK
jgi:signal transduction histidine kinase